MYPHHQFAIMHFYILFLVLIVCMPVVCFFLIRANVKRIRNHPSIALYCGSNETDWIYFCTGQNPNDDVLTRKVIPESIRENDPYRVYYPTTPLFSDEFTKKHGGRVRRLHPPRVAADRRRFPRIANLPQRKEQGQKGSREPCKYF